MMTMKKNKSQDKASTNGGFNRDSEIRIRNVAPEIKKEIAEIQKLNPKKFPFESRVIEFLVMDYRSTQTALKQLQVRNSQIHSQLLKFVERENNVAAFVKSLQEFIKDGDKTFKNLFSLSMKKAVRLSKEFSGTVRSSRTKPAGQGKRKSVPQKKGGRK